jgi:hypothetical protein
MTYVRGTIPKDPKENLKRLKDIGKHWEEETMPRLLARRDNLATRVSETEGTHQAVLQSKLDEAYDAIEELEGKLADNHKKQVIVARYIEEKEAAEEQERYLQANKDPLTAKPFAQLTQEQEDGEPIVEFTT